VQQGVRRNCLIGPVAFCLLVVLTAPYVLQDLQSLPLVEAVPFFRRAIAFRNFATAAAVEVAGGAATRGNTALGVASAAVAEPETSFELVEEQEVEEEAPPVSKGTKRKRTETTAGYNFPLFANHDSFEGDSSAAVPFRYYEAHQKSDETARKAVLASLKWRRDHEIDTILGRGHPNFDVAKRILPHYFVGRSAVSNHVVFVQRPGLADMALAKHNHVEPQDMLDQYAYVFEYCWNILHANDQTTKEGDADLMIGIMDLQGLNLSVLRKTDLIDFGKRFVGMIDAHYPTRAHKTIIVNAPGWFSMLYKIISPIMRETTKEKIVLFSAGQGQNDALEAALGKDMAELLERALRIPDKKEKKAKGKYDLTLTSDILLETEMEQEMRQFVVQRLDAEGLEMKKMKALDA